MPSSSRASRTVNAVGPAVPVIGTVIVLEVDDRETVHREFAARGVDFLSPLMCESAMLYPRPKRLPAPN